MLKHTHSRTFISHMLYYYCMTNEARMCARSHDYLKSLTLMFKCEITLYGVCVCVRAWRNAQSTHFEREVRPYGAKIKLSMASG